MNRFSSFVIQYWYIRDLFSSAECQVWFFYDEFKSISEFINYFLNGHEQKWMLK